MKNVLLELFFTEHLRATASEQSCFFADATPKTLL